MNNTSKIAVLIPHYNNPDGLLIAINSIRETLSIDIIVVDDGSQNKKIEEGIIVNNIAPNIKVIFLYLNKNRGIEHALNYGFQHLRSSNYKYIARLDCDDICAPDRFKKQYEFLEDNQEISMVGSWINFVDPQGSHLFNLKLPTQDEEIKKKMFINAMLIHPSIIFRKKILETVPQYPTKYKAAEDYAFYFEVMKKHRFANINEYLVQCEINTQGISIKNRKKQLKSRLQIIWDNFDYSMYAFYGLFRNLIIYVAPYSLIFFIKKMKR